MFTTYEDIKPLARPCYADRSSMPISDRAAQFAPFAALAGYGEAIYETARLTDDMLAMTEDRELHLNEMMLRLKDDISRQPQVTLYYFIHDERKQGGRYAMKTGRLRRIDEYSRLLIFTDRSVIAADDVCEIQLEEY